jgi:hypothetical protein
MLPEILLDYLAEVEAAFQTLKTCHFEKYEEEILTSERANLRVRARFVTGHLLEFNEAVTIKTTGSHIFLTAIIFRTKTITSFFDTTILLISPISRHFQHTNIFRVEPYPQ